MPRRGRRHLCSPVSPLDNDDILREILLCLPPRPSSFPRASFVCNRWRRLVSDPDFRRCFRARHRTPPLLGIYSGLDFVPTQDPPDRIPAARFSLDLQRDEDGGWYGWYRYFVSCCRGGLVLCCDIDEFLVFNPMSGHRHSVPSPVKDKPGMLCVTAAVVPHAADSFRIVALFSNRSHGIRAFASVYSSDTGVWEDSIDVLPTGPLTSPDLMIFRSSTLVGNAIYWMLDRPGILEFDLDRKSLIVIELPPDADIACSSKCRIVPAEGCQLGIAILAKCSIQFWERKENHGSSSARWVLHKTVHLDSVLPVGCLPIALVGFAEESKVIFIMTDGGVFMVHLETMQSRKVLEASEMSYITPYSSF